MKRPHFIGIAGASCSGKTTLAAELADRLGQSQTARIAIDSYYHGLSPTALRDVATYNFDDPKAIDHGLLVGLGVMDDRVADEDGAELGGDGGHGGGF